MYERKLLEVLEEMHPPAERRELFEWVDPEDYLFKNLDPERRKWMVGLNEGQRMLADLFYQSKPTSDD